MRLGGYVVWLTSAMLLTAPAAAQSDSTTSEFEVETALAQQIVAESVSAVEFEELVFSSIAQEMVQRRAAMTNPTIEANPPLSKILDDWIDERMSNARTIFRAHYPAIRLAQEEFFVDTYTTDELREILAFVSTPTGKKYVRSHAEVRSNPAVKAAIADFAVKIAQSDSPSVDELSERLADYIYSAEEGELVQAE